MAPREDVLDFFSTRCRPFVPPIDRRTRSIPPCDGCPLAGLRLHKSGTKHFGTQIWRSNAEDTTAPTTKRQRGDLGPRGSSEQHSELLGGDTLQGLGPLQERALHRMDRPSLNQSQPHAFATSPRARVTAAGRVTLKLQSDEEIMLVQPAPKMITPRSIAGLPN